MLADTRTLARSHARTHARTHARSHARTHARTGAGRGGGGGGGGGGGVGVYQPLPLFLRHVCCTAQCKNAAKCENATKCEIFLNVANRIEYFHKTNKSSVSHYRSVNLSSMVGRISKVVLIIEV